MLHSNQIHDISDIVDCVIHYNFYALYCFDTPFNFAGRVSKVMGYYMSPTPVFSETSGLILPCTSISKLLNILLICEPRPGVVLSGADQAFSSFVYNMLVRFTTADRYLVALKG